jgi:phosphoenolpyruvate carboxylase
MEHAKNASDAKVDEVKLINELRSLRTQIPDQPFLNPIMDVAFGLSRRLESGETSIDDVKAMTGRLMDSALKRRAIRLRERLNLVDQHTTLKEFSDFVAARIDNSVGDDEAFEKFSKRWSRARTGVVFTAHPTFGLSDALTTKLLSVASGEKNPDDVSIDLPHRPDAEIPLSYEHARAQHAVVNTRQGLVDLLQTFFAVAVERFGERAYSLRPRLATVASWVGYDLDGRTDITWRDSFLVRVQEKRTALDDIRRRFIAIKDSLSQEGDILRLIRQLGGKLDLAIAAVDEHIGALEAAKTGKISIAEASNKLSSSDGYNLTSTETLEKLLDELIAAVEAKDKKQELAALSGLVQSTGLGNSHIHVRINSVQLNNALRAYVHEPWTKDLTERQALERIVEMIRTVNPETANFETLELENSTAIRQFAMIAQMKKHVDGQTPVRFLIAECESPATILIAIFFAKLFGVLDIVDISPLFETPAGLESGARLIERLLEEEAYCDYVRKRGRLCIQTGFSDAGRFIGQIAATLSIERLHQALAQLLSRPEYNIGEAELLIFSTHGESMGRGAHPGDLHARLRYVLSNDARWRFVRKGVALKHETSFQGGDGYLWFADVPMATRALATIIQDGADTKEIEDPLYANQNLALDFLLRLREYQQSLFSHPGYRSLLGAYGPNILFKTGSRAVKRQSDSATAADRGDPARMRAIPNNAILQQFGYVANVVAGLGAAAGSERDRFVELAQESERLRSLIEMIARGKQLSSLNAMGANALVFDAGFWASRASWGREPRLEPAFRSLATHFLTDPRAGAITGLAHQLRLDAVDLHTLLEDIGLEGGKIPDDDRLELDLLHAIRLAMIMRVFILAAQLPKFAARNDISHQQTMNWALELDIPDLMSIMRVAFPRQKQTGEGDVQYSEPATYRPQSVDDYGRLETEIFGPLEDAYEFIREIGTGISHHFGAFG